MTGYSSVIINELDVPPYIVLFLLMLPIVITIISIAKYIIGIKFTGVYIPILFTYMFYQFGLEGDNFGTNIVSGLKIGLFFTILVTVVCVLTYKLIKKVSLHYYSKLAIVMTIVTFAIIIALGIGTKSGFPGLIEVNIFSLILVATITEKFMNLFATKSDKTAFTIILTTVGLGIICYITISIPALQDTILKYPIVVLISLPINFLVGKFTGLRLTEYYRFKDILNKEEEE